MAVEATPCTYRKIELVKTVELGAGEPALFTWTYCGLRRDQAVDRAWRAFKRDHPAEDLTQWTVRDAG